MTLSTLFRRQTFTAISRESLKNLWHQDSQENLTHLNLNKFDVLKISENNFGRALVLVNFGLFVEEYFPSGKRLEVAVVGGSMHEPELKLLANLGYPTSVEIFGIDDGDTWLDLNDTNGFNPALSREFDLVLCSQVLEHVWNHSGAIKILSTLLNSDGFLWLACPASNKSHASPHYFSAGFSPEYLEYQVEASSLKCVSKGQIGTARLYRATHLLPTWLTVKEHRSPFLSAFSSQSIGKQLFLRFRYHFTCFGLLFSSGKPTASGRWATESWVIASRT
jgi:hypothetical protein